MARSAASQPLLLAGPLDAGPLRAPTGPCGTGQGGCNFKLHSFLSSGFIKLALLKKIKCQKLRPAVTTFKHPVCAFLTSDGFGSNFRREARDAGGDKPQGLDTGADYAADQGPQSGDTILHGAAWLQAAAVSALAELAKLPRLDEILRILHAILICRQRDFEEAKFSLYFLATLPKDVVTPEPGTPEAKECMLETRAAFSRFRAAAVF